LLLLVVGFGSFLLKNCLSGRFLTRPGAEESTCLDDFGHYGTLVLFALNRRFWATEKPKNG